MSTRLALLLVLSLGCGGVEAPPETTVVELPRVDGWVAPRDVSRPRVVLNVVLDNDPGGTTAGGPCLWDDVGPSTSEPAERPLEDLREILARDVGETKASETLLVVRADADVSVGTLRFIRNEARELGFQRFALAVIYDGKTLRPEEGIAPGDIGELPFGFERRDVTWSGPLPPFRVRLRAGQDGTLSSVEVGHEKFGNDGAAPRRLQEFMLRAIGGDWGSGYAKEIEVAFLADDNLQWRFLAPVISASCGRVDGDRRHDNFERTYLVDEFVETPFEPEPILDLRPR